jgi:acyl carrier protein
MKIEKMMQTQQEMSDSINRQSILSSVISTIESIVQDWDLDQPIDANTRLVADLGFESIDLIQMVAALEQEFNRPNFSFAELLIVDGRYVDDLTVGQIAEALDTRI